MVGDVQRVGHARPGAADELGHGRSSLSSSLLSVAGTDLSSSFSGSSFSGSSFSGSSFSGSSFSGSSFFSGTRHSGSSDGSRSSGSPSHSTDAPLDVTGSPDSGSSLGMVGASGSWSVRSPAPGAA
ncbi:pentapeptide repeat-containing protein [Nonomuraea sp. NPDC001699]